MQQDIVRRHLWISGRVQGVWFRQSTFEEANRAGVTGWVRNLPDRRVEAVLEGPRAAVDEVVAWCHQGPPHANVLEVRVKDEEPKGLEAFTFVG